MQLYLILIITIGDRYYYLHFTNINWRVTRINLAAKLSIWHIWDLNLDLPLSSPVLIFKS